MSARAIRIGSLVASLVAALLIMVVSTSAHALNHSAHAAHHSAHAAHTSSEQPSGISLAENSQSHSHDRSTSQDHGTNHRHRHGYDCPAHENCTCVDFGFCSYPDGTAHAKVNTPKQRFIAVRLKQRPRLTITVDFLDEVSDLANKSADSVASLSRGKGRWRAVLYSESPRLRL